LSSSIKGPFRAALLPFSLFFAMMLPSCRKSAALAAVALSSAVLLLHAFSLPAASALSVGLARRHRHDATPGLAAGCDVFSGSWVLDGGGSSAAYTGYNCPLIDAEFNCQLYGRPDSDYLRYLWKPAGCELPRCVRGSERQPCLMNPRRQTRACMRA
jgi:hypothetical protein